MARRDLSPELSARIVLLLANNRTDLLALCQTSKAFQKEVEARLYHTLQFSTPSRALAAATTIANNERIAACVKSWWFNPEMRRSQSSNLGRPFWSTIQSALIAMVHLEFMFMCDYSGINTWIFNTPNIQFRLKELKVRFTWDEALAKFIHSQPSVRMLHLYDPMEEPIMSQLPPDTMPDLRVFDGTLMLAVQFLSPQLSHAQFFLDSEGDAMLANLHRFCTAHKVLRALSLLELPEDPSVNCKLLEAVASTLPGLRHLGLFSYPVIHRHEFHRHLMSMHSLHTIELDITKWVPLPAMPAGHKVLLAELRMYCPTLKTVIFWLGNTKVRWTFTYQWTSRVDSHQYPHLSLTYMQA